MDGHELLRRYCLDDPRLTANASPPAMPLEWRTATLVRLAALIAVSAPGASMRTAVDDAIASGVGADEIVAVLDGLVDIIGLPRAVAVAPRIALALGYDADDVTSDDD